MSDYLTHLIERSLGLPPQIEPLIAPIHAPTGLLLTETVETPAAFESSPAAKIVTLQQDAPPDVAVNARAVEPAFSQMGSQPARHSNPLPESQSEFPIEKKDDRPHSSESPRKVRSRQTSSASRPETTTTDITGSRHPAPDPLPLHGTPIVSQGTTQIVVQPEIINPLKPATAPAISLLHPSPKKPSAIHVTIGRVEVRAIMPAAQVKPPPERSVPKMSLDDYLRSRNRGAP
jgi:hypothetical protein